MRAGWLGCAVAAAMAVLASAAPANAANPFELNFWLSGPRYDGVLPTCEDSSALELIQHRFRHKEDKFWNSELIIVGFEKVHETAFRPWAPNTIPRRFCSAMALVSDGLKHPIHYSIGENTGMIGASWGI